MADDRYSRNDDTNRYDRYRYDNRGDRNAYGSNRDSASGGSRGGGYSDRDYGGDREGSRSGRDYYGGARYDSDLKRDDDRSSGRSAYGRSSYEQPLHDREGRGERSFSGGYNDRGSSQYGDRDGRYDQGRGGQYRGSYAHDGHRFTDTDDRDHRRDRNRDYGDDRNRDRRPPQGYDYDDRGFLDRAGDEVRSWFGDDEAERRREADQRYDERTSRYDDRVRGDHDYRSWRDQQVTAFDRDYDEYRQENASKFHHEFAAWRTERQGQRDSLTRVSEHMEVLGSDGEHVGTVDKVRGDRIILTKNDVDAGGHHHSIPSRWVDSVDDKVKLRKTAAEAQKAWRDEEQGQAMFGQSGGNNDRSRSATTTGQAIGAGTSTTAGTTGTANRSGDADDKSTNLNRSFPGTY